MSNGGSYDVIVVGAGSMGMSAGYHLARSGLRTLLIDAFDPPHQEGSHHGEPRLIRHAYHGGPAYIAMALRAHELWRELEELTRTELLVQSGVLNLSAESIYSYQQRVEDAQDLDLGIEYLNADEINKRWPVIQLTDDFKGLYEPRAGYLYSEQCVRSYRQAALAEGAELLTYAEVEHIEVNERFAAVRIKDGRTFYADHAILSAGAWFSTLKGFIDLPIRPVRKVVGWFEPSTSAFDADRFPGFTLNSPYGGYYGFPSIGGAGLKIGRHDTGEGWLPGQPLKPFGSLPEDEGDLRAALEAYMPQAAGTLLRGAVCKYEFTPDDDFIIDRHPQYPNVLLAGGFSGHGFKFSSVVGEILADLVNKGSTSLDISKFAVSRFHSLTTTR
ncbi:N-methyl-L-tryptophan oxidase [Paenibacillus sp. GCM10012307]|uniref:N-methyl-L-tryptophan oxidase n=1 Tax=Paenibacillus roseus TaxID=2798579 RepID=A0A934JAZ9_9BACL|nr:N-methyl-L-tryptophan oxidase [Paenibacillus roseus]MBJ6363727.1 N-methyl-L-tryptophan oxidase [Paenibacillus roseus]